MKQSSAIAGVEPELAERLAGAFVDFYGKLQPPGDLFAGEVLFDVNVPQWRLQFEGPDDFTNWLRNYTDVGYELDVRRLTPTLKGFVLEVEGRYDHHGRRLYFRNLIECEVSGERITEVIFYCTGDWEPETVRQHAAEVRLVRP